MLILHFHNSLQYQHCHHLLHLQESYTKFLIDTCGVGLVPFEYFGSKQNNGWFRMSIGGVDLNEINYILNCLVNVAEKSLIENASKIF